VSPGTRARLSAADGSISTEYQVRPFA
jgi:hypothetical protein